MAGLKKFSWISILVLVQNGNIIPIHVVVFLGNMLVDEWRLMTFDVLSVILNSKFNLFWSFPNVAHVTIVPWYFVDYITSTKYHVAIVTCATLGKLQNKLNLELKLTEITSHNIINLHSSTNTLPRNTTTWIGTMFPFWTSTKILIHENFLRPAIHKSPA